MKIVRAALDDGLRGAKDISTQEPNKEVHIPFPTDYVVDMSGSTP
jgi:hypothetical protein